MADYWRVSIRSFVPRNCEFLDGGWDDSVIYVKGNRPERAEAMIVMLIHLRMTEVTKYTPSTLHISDVSLSELPLFACAYSKLQGGKGWAIDI